MTRQWSAHRTDPDSLFSRHLLPVTEAIPTKLFEEAALPPLLSLSSASRAFHLVSQSVHLIALSGPALTATLTSRRWLSVIYVESGELELLHPQHPCVCAAGTWVLMPGCSMIWKSTAFRVICLLISPEEIAPDRRICRPEAMDRAVPGLPEWPQTLSSSTQTLGGVLLEMLNSLLNSTSRLHGHDPALLEQLAIGEQVRRIVAALVDHKAACLPSGHSGQQTESREEDHFDDLIRYIQSNLHQPLNLTVLATQSHYSRRALQYAFRNRLGCTATQWIRNQRLDLAWQLLQAASPGDNVTRVAQACGYRSLSLFSIEFQHRFHIKPSVLLRNRRDHQGMPGPKHDDGTSRS